LGALLPPLWGDKRLLSGVQKLLLVDRNVVVSGQAAFRAKAHKADVQSARSDKGDFR
jgi:hypothetical protein